MTPDPLLPVRPESEARLDVHNANVDEELAESGRCGTLDLRSGRVCQLPALHGGSCEFVNPGEQS